MPIKLIETVPSFDRDGFYAALADSCAPATDEELGYELLIRIDQVPSNQITKKQLTNARLRVNHCKKGWRTQAFKTSELMVIQSLTGVPSVLFWMCESLGYEKPTRMNAHQRYDQLTREMHGLERRMLVITSERTRIEPLVESESRPPTLVPCPGQFAADSILYNQI